MSGEKPCKSNGELLNALEASGIIRDLNPDELKALANLAEQLTFPKDATIIFEDDKSRDLYMICEGSVSIHISLPSDHGREEVLYTMREGQIFGELALVDGSRRSASVRAEEPVRVYIFEYDKLNALFEKFPRIGFVLMRNIAAIIAQRVRNTNMLWRNSLVW